jgi:hypothetical protein
VNGIIDQNVKLAFEPAGDLVILHTPNIRELANDVQLCAKVWQ